MYLYKLPVTKAILKEMLPVVDKLLIQYVVQEAIAAGDQGDHPCYPPSKNSIENHFDKSWNWKPRWKTRQRQLLAEVQNICPKDVTIMHIRYQGEAKGLGHAILCARPLVGDNPFAVLLPDVLTMMWRAT